MIRIGLFSKLSQVPVKTLRYYDEIGLLEPAEIDSFTDYRYYSVTQLPRLNRILALKDLGLSLNQIAQLLTEELPVEQLR
ncbi:MAG: MerR family transcriptional regulator, partial [Anaerolineales bacterium]|nr:MerR family transcriptional regulator [Anaerolineales bacterium]